MLRRTVQLFAAVFFMLVAVSGQTRATQQQVEFYSSMPLNARVALQRHLIWTDVFRGIADGAIGPRTIRAIEEFQVRNGGRRTGILGTNELSSLIEQSNNAQSAVGYTIFNDQNTNTTIGKPAAFFSRMENARRGTRFTSPNATVDLMTMDIPTQKGLYVNSMK